ncbi:MAG TPA: PIG-L deacetylase family protein [Ilumatobacter sp.]|nr:PIG-L deacetylase family protein [Ilumatobacter sp.]
MSPNRVYCSLSTAAHAIEPRLAAGWRWATRVAARDETDSIGGRSCMVVAPHPDDETIGCGATIARKRARGTPVSVVIVADGRYAQSRSRAVSPSALAAIRAAEASAACEQLGVRAEHLIQLGFEDNHVSGQEAALSAQLHDLLVRLQPDEVLVVSDLDHHPDHRAVNRATYDALARWDGSPIVREFPVWSWIDGPWLDQRNRSAVGRATHLVVQPLRALARGRPVKVSTTGFAEVKRAALAAHASQTSAYTDEPEWAVMDDELLSVFRDDIEVFLPSASSAERNRRC